MLAEAGVTDLSCYGRDATPMLDLYMDPPDGSEPAILAGPPGTAPRVPTVGNTAGQETSHD